jgi:hypothetical protein
MVARRAPAEEMLDHLRSFEAAGVSQLTLSLVCPAGRRGIERFAPILDTLRR